MKFVYYLKLLKMGFTIKETNILKKKVNIMTIKEILKLGDMGYTKEEISDMESEPDVDLNKQIETLENQIKSLKDSLQVSNVQETVTEKADEKNTEDDLEKALNLLAGKGTDNGGNETVN